MPETFEYQRRVEFRDTDMAGIVHFSVFFAYMEEAEHELLRSLDLNVISHIDGQKISWPRVNAQCDYRRAIRYDDVVTIRVQVQRIGDTSVTYAFRFDRGEDRIAEGSVTTVCCTFEYGASPQAVTIPDLFRSRLQRYAC